MYFWHLYIENCMHVVESGAATTTNIRGLESLDSCMRMLRMVLAQSVAGNLQLDKKDSSKKLNLKCFYLL